jgi:hypothetical protein
MDATKLVQSNRDKLSPLGNSVPRDKLEAVRINLQQHAPANLLPTESYHNNGMPIDEYILQDVRQALISTKQQNECSDFNLMVQIFTGDNIADINYDLVNLAKTRLNIETKISDIYKDVNKEKVLPTPAFLLDASHIFARFSTTTGLRRT